MVLWAMPRALHNLGTWLLVSCQLQLQQWLKVVQKQLRPQLQRVQAISVGDFYMVFTLWAHRVQECLRLGNLCISYTFPREPIHFLGCIEKRRCPGRSLLKGQSPHGKLLLG